MDPQHRLLLELGIEALEDAGVPPSTLRGSDTGVFVGQSAQDWWGWTTMPSERALIGPYTNIGGNASLSSSRLSHQLDLRGPCFTVDTACSSGITAVL